MKISQLKTTEELRRSDLQDPEFRELWNKTALARAVAISLIRYRDKEGLTQKDLARLVGMKQPAIARLEAGEINPKWETLIRLAEALRLEFLVDIAPRRRTALIGKKIKASAEVVEMSDDGKLLVAVR